ncbi:MAG: AAA family ATPase [Desulfobacterales bacterium]|nr:AAA family ATPase [Desulfobacterales bacterium]
MAKYNPKQALEKLNILYELSGDQLKEMYVERPDKPMMRAEALLRGKSKQQKILLTGQHGCGKTTELNKLAEIISDEYFVVNCGQGQLRDMEEPSDIEFLFVLLRAFFHTAKQFNTRFDRVEKKLRNIIKIKDIDFKLSIMGITLSSPISKSDDITHEASIRQEFKSFYSELLSIVNMAIEEVESFHGLPVLLIVDDVEKLDEEQVGVLLWKHSHLLSSLPCAAIYTIYPWLMFEGELLTKLRDEFFIIDIANVPLLQKDGDEFADGFHFLEMIIERRTGKQNIWLKPECRRITIGASGGHLRQCLSLTHSAMLFASQTAPLKIDFSHIIRVIQDAERDYRRLLSFEDRNILREVLKTNEYYYNLPRRLLNNLSVLEYWHPDWSTWYGVNPLTFSSIGESSLSEAIREMENENA